MLKSELMELVKTVQKEKCEGQTLEVKTAQGGCPKLYETLSSFSNQNQGGVILFGISEKDGFLPVGVGDVQELIHHAGEQCRQMTPEVRAVFTDCELDGMQFVAMEIPAAEVSQRPVCYAGAGRIKGSFIRVGDADERMTEYEVYSYEAYRKQLRDDLRTAEAELSSLNQTELSRYALRVRVDRPNTQSLQDDELLELLGVTRKGAPTLAAVMMFSKFPQAVYPQLCMTAVAVPGEQMGDVNEHGERFTDNKKIEGTIPQMIEQAVAFVARNMRYGVAFQDGARVDLPQYPLTAVREIVINALIHRDYSPYTEGMPVRLEMYRNRIEIVNAGGLYGAIDVDELGRIHADTRNKTLISLAETMHIVENRYSGIPTVRKLMAEAGLPAPVFEDRRGCFRVILYSRSPQTEQGGEGQDLAVFCATPRTRKEIAEYLGKTQQYAMKRYVEPLIAQGVLRYTIPEKPRSWAQRIVKA